ncbi:uncharacterized protein FIBRA_02628 [Fibroporia radiculosa]|uniref:F-box domain-containing protein n=1 Tax=Fibroporia radiculosa TaxID=599839 RepID=J4HV82_9APHY|nr:uncharacterized protein FIBRA_02628 [Fibroporia radiculosa]CCM00592.1 predicted protein [Fibroporia radiculosa]
MSSPSLEASPISLVPDDVLHEIFHQAAALSFGRWPMFDYSGCLALSHVCRYWRRLSFASPQLWSFIYVNSRTSLSMLHTYLGRSLDSPLHVKFEGQRSILDSTDDIGCRARVVSSHVDRIVEFHALRLRPTEMSTVLAAFTHPAPVLRSLTLQADAQMLSRAIFSGRMPLLRRVDIRGISMGWLSCADLTALVLHDQLVPPLHRLLWTLSMCSSLQVLSLRLLGALGEVESQQTQHDLMVGLPYLTKLSLGLHVRDDVLTVLSHLSFPPSTSVSLHFTGIHQPAVDITHCCPSLAAIINNEKDLTVELTGAYMWSTYVAIRTPRNRLHLQWEWVEDGIHNDMIDFVGFSTVTFPALRHLTISANSYRLTEDRWLQILASVPSVTSLELDFRDSMVLAFLDAFTRKHRVSDESSASVLACPNLARVCISRIEEQESVLEKMAASLRTRALEGSNLESLEILLRTQKDFPSSAYDSLVEIIPRVAIRY